MSAIVRRVLLSAVIAEFCQPTNNLTIPTTHPTSHATITIPCAVAHQIDGCTFELAPDGELSIARSGGPLVSFTPEQALPCDSSCACRVWPR